MSEKKQTTSRVKGDVIQATIGDNVHQVAVGKNIRQQENIGSTQVTEADFEQVKSLFEELKKQIEQQAPPDKKAAALEHVDELQQEITSKKPDLSTFDYVKHWFGKNLPGLLGAVTSVVIHPIVGKVVEAASGLAADAFRRRFGG